MSVSRVLVVCALLLLLSPLHAAAWGAMGHYMTAAIAQNFLTPNATNAINNLLPETDGDMGAVASWADTVARKLYPWSPPLHYINTPDWACSYDRTRDCKDDSGNPGVCVDGAIQNFTKQLVTGSAPLTANVAVKFTIHFIGDIHQPLHCGFTSDEGGNTIIGTFEGTSNRRLHAVWDEDIIEKRLNDDYQGDNSTYLSYFVNRLQSGDWKSTVAQWRSCPTTEPSPIDACSQSWAVESVGLACSTAYTDQDGNKIQNGFDLEDGYYNFALPVVEQRLAQGGIRLANVLNAIFAQPSMAAYVVPPHRFRKVTRETIEEF